MTLQINNDVITLQDKFCNKMKSGSVVVVIVHSDSSALPSLR